MSKESYTEYGPLTIGKKVYIYPGGRFCLPKEARIASDIGNNIETNNYSPCNPVIIGDNSIIGVDAVIYEGSTLEESVILEDRVRIGYDCKIGSGSRLMYGAYICDRVKIGSSSRIAGFLCDAVTVGERSTVMGNLVHSYVVPDLSWGEDEPAPLIGDDCVVGHSSVIVGGVRIGDNSYITAGALVTKDVPKNTIVTGKNEHHSVSDWKGKGLTDLYARKEVER
ncbi:MAG TPA: acetyl/acyl transferase [Gammaproteobacteria bacterium]|nr:acetyl/acyl transferase [Gammaproteobacteria bacterium]